MLRLIIGSTFCYYMSDTGDDYSLHMLDGLCVQ